MDESKQYWFPAKRYGWGWGLPIRWQGWVALAAFFILLFAGSLVFRPEQSPFAFAAYATILALALVGICFAKGEPPSWRWGDP